MVKDVMHYNKKKYFKPYLEVIKIDPNVVLMAGTGTGPPFNSPPLDINDSPKETGYKSYPPSSSSNPFGGDRPDYER